LGGWGVVTFCTPKKRIFYAKKAFFTPKCFFYAKMLFLRQNAFFTPKCFFYAKKHFFTSKRFYAEKHFSRQKTFLNSLGFGSHIRARKNGLFFTKCSCFLRNFQAGNSAGRPSP